VVVDPPALLVDADVIPPPLVVFVVFDVVDMFDVVDVIPPPLVVFDMVDALVVSDMVDALVVVAWLPVDTPLPPLPLGRSYV
jgi:hypothetical protein